MVVSKGLTVHEAAQECNINISTAKGIVDIYMKEGRIGKKKKRDRPTNIITNYIIANVNPMQMGAPASVMPVATLYSTRYPPGYPGKQKDAMVPPQPPQFQGQAQGQGQMQFPGFPNPPFPMNMNHMNQVNQMRYPPQMNQQNMQNMQNMAGMQNMQNMTMNRFQPSQMLPSPQMQFPNGYMQPNFMMNQYNNYNQTPQQMNMNMFPPNMQRQPITSSTQPSIPAQQQPLLSPVKVEDKQ